MDRKDFLKAGLVMIGGVWVPKQQGATIIVRGPIKHAPASTGPALVASVATGGTINGVTSSSIDTTGVNLLIASVSWYPAGGADVQTAQFSDSKGNTWSQLNLAGTISVSLTANRLFYCVPTSVGSGHTFTASQTSSYPAIAVLAFSGMSGTPLDQQSQGEASAVTTVQPGSITATQANTVLVSGVGFDVNGTTASIDLSFTGAVVVSPSTGNNVGAGIAYHIDTSATATNPTWTKTGGTSHMSASIASFKY